MGKGFSRNRIFRKYKIITEPRVYRETGITGAYEIFKTTKLPRSCEFAQFQLTQIHSQLRNLSEDQGN